MESGRGQTMTGLVDHGEECDFVLHAIGSHRWIRGGRWHDRTSEWPRTSFPQGTLASPCFGHSHHDFGLLYEILFRHSSFLNGFDGHLVLVEPVAKVHQAELPAANLLHKSELRGMNHPFPWRGRDGFPGLACSSYEV